MENTIQYSTKIKKLKQYCACKVLSRLKMDKLSTKMFTLKLEIATQEGKTTCT